MRPVQSEEAMATKKAWRGGNFANCGSHGTWFRCSCALCQSEASDLAVQGATPLCAPHSCRHRVKILGEFAVELAQLHGVMSCRYGPLRRNCLIEQCQFQPVWVHCYGMHASMNSSISRSYLSAFFSHAATFAMLASLMGLPI